MTERNTAAQASDQGQDHERKGSSVNPAAIIVAALVAATTALLRPFVEASTENAVLVAVLLSVATTTSNAVFTDLVDKFKHGSTDTRWKPLWKPLLFAGPLAGLAACLIGISVISGAELALGKVPSILPNGTPIISPALISSYYDSYYFDADGDNLGSGNPVDYEQGSQPPRWVQKSGDKCPDIPGPPENDGCPNSRLLIWYFSDVDGDGIGDRIGERGIASPTQYERGTQPLGWVELNGDICPDVFNPEQDRTDNNINGLPDACERLPK
jgi:hypothetical protein